MLVVSVSALLLLSPSIVPLAVPSEAALAMELGADACLVNTAVAGAKKPELMAAAFREGVEAGRKAFLAGRIPRKAYAAASSPTQGQIE